MKKLIITTLIIILIPFIIVTIFIKDETIKFNFISNSVVRVKRENGNIDRVFFEEYVKGVLAGEMPTSFDLEALKAQAVAARTYVLRKIEYAKNQEYDVVDTVTNQVYYSNGELKERWKTEYNEKINLIQKAVL